MFKYPGWDTSGSPDLGPLALGPWPFATPQIRH
jgi:hypothetical protein